MTRFNSKHEARQAIEDAAYPCAAPLWIGPSFVKAYSVRVPGWYAVSSIRCEVVL